MTKLPEELRTCCVCLEEVCVQQKVHTLPPLPNSLQFLPFAPPTRRRRPFTLLFPSAPSPSCFPPPLHPPAPPASSSPPSSPLPPTPLSPLNPLPQPPPSAPHSAPSISPLHQPSLPSSSAPSVTPLRTLSHPPQPLPQPPQPPASRFLPLSLLPHPSALPPPDLRPTLTHPHPNPIRRRSAGPHSAMPAHFPRRVRRGMAQEEEGRQNQDNCETVRVTPGRFNVISF